MDIIARILFSILLIYTSAYTVWPALRWPWIARCITVIIAILICSFAALVIPSPAGIARAFVAILGLMTALRIYSYVQSGLWLGFFNYAVFLSIGLLQPYLVYSPARQFRLPRMPGIREFIEFIMAGALVPLTWIAARWIILTEPVANSWILNHLVLAAGFIIIMQALSRCCEVLWRVQGFRVKPIINNIILSQTPADFWRRWSWPIHQWLHCYIFLPVKARRGKIQAILAVFLFSALFHEILVSVIFGRMTGHQSLFFILNALGVLASPTLERLGTWGLPGRLLMRLVTITFMILTAALMFTTFHYLYPIYVHENWLMW